MTRETKAQKAARIGDMLAAYDELTRTISKAESDLKTIKEQLRTTAEGTYGDWSLSFGTPRTIMDQAAVRKQYAERDEALPMVETKAPLVVRPAVAK